MEKMDYFIKEYLANRPFFMALIRPQEAIFFDNCKKKIKNPVLDFGCGDGFFTRTVFGKKQIEVGLDLYDSRAKEAEQSGIYRKVSYYDGRLIPYPDNHFQTVVSNCVLEHIPNLNQSLHEIYRVLKPHGFLIVTVMTNQWEQHLFGRKILGNIYVKWMRQKQFHLNLFTLDQWNRVFTKIGFRINLNRGYLSPKNSSWLDIAHYLSLPSLLSYMLFRQWNFFPRLPINARLVNFIKTQSVPFNDKNNSSALFYLLKKPKTFSHFCR